MLHDDLYAKLKGGNDILSVAFLLGFDGRRTGSYYQGGCPAHGSSGGRCLTIWPNIQAWKCFHCGQKGDVIDLVMHYKRCDHKTALQFLSEKSGIPCFNGKELSPEEIKKTESDMVEKILVENMLTEATRWYHSQLNNYPDIINHLTNHYGFSKNIIDELQIGFAPVSGEYDGPSALAAHLNSIPEFRGKLSLTGLFSFKNHTGPYYDYFKGRIVFPYWLNGKVVYMLARATSITPPDKYECHTDNQNNIKKDDRGIHEFIKYKKLRSHDSNDEKRKHFSKYIRNDVFMGENTVYGSNEIIITEGAPDWVSAVDKGFKAISPVTVTFREEDFEKLQNLTKNINAIYIINDNEENEAGLKGALKTGKYLAQRGRNVFLVMLPKPAGIKKIDLNEYLKDHSADDLQKLMTNAKSIIEIMIDGLPQDFLKAQHLIKAEIAPLLTDIDEARLQYYMKILVRKTKSSVKVIQAEIEAARELKRQQESAKTFLQ